MYKLNNQTIKIGVIGGLLLAITLFILIAIITYVSESGWIIYSFQFIIIILSAAIGIVAVRIDRDSSNRIKMNAAITSGIAGAISGALSTTTLFITSECIIYIKYGIPSTTSIDSQVHFVSLPGVIIIDMFAIIFFTICTIMVAAIAGMIYARFYGQS